VADEWCLNMGLDAGDMHKRGRRAYMCIAHFAPDDVDPVTLEPRRGAIPKVGRRLMKTFGVCERVGHIFALDVIDY